MPDEYGRLTYDEFCDRVEKVFATFPKEIQDNYCIQIQEKMPTVFNSIKFGFYKFDDKSIVLCYWGFKMRNLFTEEHVSNVIRHELKHAIEPDKRVGAKEDFENNSIDYKENHNKMLQCPKCKKYMVILGHFTHEIVETSRIFLACFNEKCDFFEMYR